MKLLNNIVLSLILILAVSAHAHENGIYDAREYGAEGDGKTLDTKAIQESIDECSQTGGTVYFPPGTYLSGTIILKSNVTLQISQGAVLLGSTDIKDYIKKIPKIRSYTDQYVNQSLIYGEDLENIAITGHGLIDGQGSAFKVTTKKKPDRYWNRPYLIRIINSRNIHIENIRLQNSAMWMQHYLACDRLFIRGITVYNHCNQNNDMIDIDGCSNVLISDCIGDSDDDALTIKSTSNYISKNITVTNCVLSSHCNAIKLGTESHGGFENITINNCVVKPSASQEKIYGFRNGISGITLGCVDGGTLNGIMISNIRIEGPKVPICLRLGDRGRLYKEGIPRPPVGTYKNVSISNITATGADTIGCSITGLPEHPVENISLSNIRIQFKGGAKKLTDPWSVEEKPEHYPESTMFGKLPAYGFFIRHARNVHLTDIEISFEEEDERSAVICDDVEGLDLIDVRGEGSVSGAPLFQFRNVKSAFISSSRALNPINVFLQIEGNSKDIYLSGNDFRHANTAINLTESLPPKTVHLKGNFFKEQKD